MKRPYPRCTTLEFLNFCDPRIRAFYEYWASKRGRRTMPSRSDINPSEIVAFLPSVIILDVISQNPLRLRYRLVGTMEAEARGGDPTGKLVGEAFYGRSAHEVLENYRLAVTRAAPVYDGDYVSLPTPENGALEEMGTILLPLSDDDQTVNKVIVFTALGQTPSRATTPRRNVLSRYPGRGQLLSRLGRSARSLGLSPGHTGRGASRIILRRRITRIDERRAREALHGDWRGTSVVAEKPREVRRRPQRTR